jgi:hypothetical protein
MKGFELVKREDHWALYNEDGHKIAATIDGCNSKLSKENCDEIFGIFDVGALALEECNNTDPLRLDSVKYKQDPYFRIGYLKGYNKAMELNKDKLFTEDDLYRVFLINSAGNNTTLRHFFEETVLSMFEQPTEIEVEIVSELAYTVNENSETEMMPEPHIKLDENGCLILKKK